LPAASVISTTTLTVTPAMNTIAADQPTGRGTTINAGATAVQLHVLGCATVRLRRREPPTFAAHNIELPDGSQTRPGIP
jgi:hypothetical protein